MSKRKTPQQVATQTVTEVLAGLVDEVVAALQRGRIRWERPWSSTAPLPHNGVTGRVYRGANLGLLLGRSPSAEFFSLKQVGKLKATIKPNATLYPVIFGARVGGGDNAERLPVVAQPPPSPADPPEGPVYPNDLPDDDPSWVWGPNLTQKLVERESNPRGVGVFVWRVYLVVAREDCEGLPPSRFVGARAVTGRQHERDPLSDRAIARTAARIREIGDQAFYSPSHDEICVPPLGDFRSANHFYGTLWHELIHWTGHRSRLDRFRAENSQYGQANYAFEELVAEFGSLFCGTVFGTAVDEVQANNVQYIAGWVSRLRDHPATLQRALAKASQAFEFLIPDVMTAIDVTTLAPDDQAKALRLRGGAAPRLPTRRTRASTQSRVKNGPVLPGQWDMLGEPPQVFGQDPEFSVREVASYYWWNRRRKHLVYREAHERQIDANLDIWTVQELLDALFRDWSFVFWRAKECADRVGGQRALDWPTVAADLTQQLYEAVDVAITQPSETCVLLLIALKTAGRVAWGTQSWMTQPKISCSASRAQLSLVFCDAQTGEQTGYAERYFRLSNEKFEVYHAFFRVEPRFAGGGQGYLVFRSQIEAYRHFRFSPPQFGIGQPCKLVTVSAAGGGSFNGAYTWGRFGFSHASAYERDDLFRAAVTDLQATMLTRMSHDELRAELTRDSDGELRPGNIGRIVVRLPDGTMKHWGKDWLSQRGWSGKFDLRDNSADLRFMVAYPRISLSIRKALEEGQIQTSPTGAYTQLEHWRPAPRTNPPGALVIDCRRMPRLALSAAERKHNAAIVAEKERNR